MLCNISRCKDKQAMKFVQLIEYNLRNIFLEKSPRKYSGEVSPRTFYKKSDLSISLNQKSVFIVCSSRCLPKYINSC